MTHQRSDSIERGRGKVMLDTRAIGTGSHRYSLVLTVLCPMLAISLWQFSAMAQQEEESDRPTLEELADSDRPRGNLASTEPIYIDFEDVSLLDVISAIGLKTGRNFEVDPNLANQKVTIISNHAIPGELAYDILESILAGRNFVMVETLDGNLVKIMPRAGTSGNDKLHIYKGSLPPLEGFDRYSIHVVEVQYADATEVAELLKKVGSGNDEITVYQKTNLLIIKDTADGVRNMMTLLEVIDVPGTGSTVEIFTLEFTRAEALAQQITEVLMGDEGSGGQRSAAAQRAAATTAIARRNPRAAAIPGQLQAAIIGQGEEILRMVSDERLNALIVVASEGLMEQVRYLIGQLDTPTPFESNNMHYIELLNADAEEVVEALDAITSTAPRQGGNQGGGQSGEVQPFEKDIVITSFEPTNGLIILATPQDFKLLKNMIDHLDVPRRQVNVEAIIMQVTVSNDISLSVELAGLTNETAFGLSNAVSIANLLTGGVSSLAGAGGVLGIMDGTIEVPDLLGGGGTFSIPNVPFLLRALETITDTEVLSRPNLLAVDNTPAEITVGQDIPIIQSLADTNTTGFISRSTVSRRDVGVRMSVTPQINEGDYVYMEIEVEVSSTAISDIGIDPNATGATINQTLIRSEVVVGDGQTGIIGGLLSENSSRSVSQVPILGDLPLIGWLFRTRGNDRLKKNLVVLLTPHVIKRGEDFKRITDYRVEQFYQENLDAIFEEGGFIKKIKAKKKQRKKHPTEQFNPDTIQGQKFGRSEIER